MNTKSVTGELASHAPQAREVFTLSAFRTSRVSVACEQAFEGRVCGNFQRKKRLFCSLKWHLALDTLKAKE